MFLFPSDFQINVISCEKIRFIRTAVAHFFCLLITVRYFIFGKDDLDTEALEYHLRVLSRQRKESLRYLTNKIRVSICKLIAIVVESKDSHVSKHNH